ncbi:hypothetical protein GCM10027275_14890 [Rhabdobacter roseus]|uniref:Uncharacterized protein YjlB n=1 Tax=Rhabdobacter roseus TaxID=1655419 RepID=A0A840TUQ0_9BACT|nr:cupin domain-containing protein [Rhabdobacter roseus]MBB5283409.1 uncharacterized protein YjlB [Rhabdobacter roseus]
MQPTEPELLLFPDDGTIPNSKYPLLLYRQAFAAQGTRSAEWLEDTFAAHHWTNSWRWGVYPFHHYHSNTHEVLGVFSGSALLQLGGEQGPSVQVQAGDVIVIPAGVGHKCLRHSDEFTVVGAYPDGLSPDLKKGQPGDRPEADQNLAQVPMPTTDPLYGAEAGLRKIWK